jgi:hypothetical protein
MSEKKRGRKPGIALLGIADTYVDAMMWKDMLDQQSIPCMVRDGSAPAAQLAGGFLPGPGQMEVYVPATALHRARQIVGPGLAQPGVEPTAASQGLSLVWLALIFAPIAFAGIAAIVILLGSV